MLSDSPARSGDPLAAGADVLVTVRGGTLRGRQENGLTVLRGVRYATAPRFGPPAPEQPWPGVRDAVEHGGVSPQPPARPGSAGGAPQIGVQSEDCLNLTIVTPAADGARRPVIVWLHGGSYRSGAGSWDRYRTDRLAREGDVVVISVNSRLGALGYLSAPGVSPGNLGLLDQLEALRWVRDNAADLGGDPGNVTLVGQSSGAHSIACLLGVAQARPLFRRVVLQSPPLGLGLGGAPDTGRLGERFLARLGGDPSEASLEQLLAAQQAAERDVAGRGFTPAYGPVAGADPLPDAEGWLAACRAGAPDLDVVLGTTRREMAYFLGGGPISERVPLVGRAVENGVIGVVTWTAFTRPTLRFARLLSGAGARVFVYGIDGPASASPYRAGHCSDLPWLFGDEAAWAQTPMLAGQSWQDVTEHGRALRSAWLSFAAGGAPALTELGWQPYRGRRAAVHRFGTARSAGLGY
ncbi:carboxylesterase family protein [Catellatospora citrea]|uniref:Carboxylic ester hydrolase n=1 Tax=Catellatospora citrea TaxID=53366 RepID=A0A8J3KBB3_9ACTN|nr:carboxylesterase family protein [Catellatospora citrea]RKE11343.1 carboxylesterase type B [Catellatospora citrea]GIF96811.1 carboxylic ester hydrolase [Catellatospora citrea]